jgi:Na+/H+ antiporter NhaD/arsenite permease-like protein
MNRQLVLIVLAALVPDCAYAGDLEGAALGWPWALPFLGILLTIALAPLLAPRFWHRHYGKLAFMWATLTLAPLAAIFSVSQAFAAAVHVLLGEYVSFIVLLFALYVVAGGILVTANLRATPLVNGSILLIGTLLASVVGTTGATMILIRPLLRANAARLNNAHVVVFFIILVANVGGALSPIGDPPLFVGFLRGVDFFWPLRHLGLPTAIVAGYLLTVFLLVDLWFHRRDRLITTVGEARLPLHLRVRGILNLVLIACIIGVILAAARWKPGIAFDVYGTRLELQNILRDVALVSIALLSLVLTRDEHREANGFTWDPMVEVAILFAGIFACAGPILVMMAAGSEGAFQPLLAAVTTADGMPHNVAYFWLTGALSAILDNVPTYLVFFQLAGGDAQALTGPLAGTLAAISMGAVYLGALTYIGNAPNMMAYAIAVERGVKMPSFFGYTIRAAVILLPVLVLLTVVFGGLK